MKTTHAIKQIAMTGIAALALSTASAQTTQASTNAQPTQVTQQAPLQQNDSSPKLGLFYESKIQSKELGSFGFTLHDAPAIDQFAKITYGNAYAYADVKFDLETMNNYSRLYAIGGTWNKGIAHFAAEMEVFDVPGFDRWPELYTTLNFDVKAPLIGKLSIGGDADMPFRSNQQGQSGLLAFNIGKRIDLTHGFHASIQNKTTYMLGNYFGVTGLGANTTIVDVSKDLGKHVSAFVAYQHNQSLNSNLETKESFQAGFRVTF